MKRLRRALMLAGLASSLACGVHAAETDQAYGAYQAGHYRRAQEEALKRVEANSNDAAAMTLLGEIYRQGLGVAPDQKAATEWYERAAERGDINAVYALAIALLDDGNPKHDATRAGVLLERAAAAGHPAANYNLAITLLATGRSTDAQRAVACIELAAKAGLGDAQYALGSLYKQGRGVDQDNAKAAEWMAKAVESGTIAAEIEYAIMLFNGDGVTKDEVAAARLFLRAANKGNAIAQNRLARLYQAGRGIAPDKAEAAAWHLAARAQGLDDPVLDRLVDGLTPEQLNRAARLAAQRIEGTALTTPSQPSK
ncbi:tetratricopeptide repeat protein [Bosea sp. (in: a-proteobacteria)]|jgi:TPR repeat protein|uniref:tetratricopeptide repeat protein n=1 Tax=Bosea sp. (in: a-proteobacteria) TaxID=1871050 RepID=UPI003F721017